MARWFDRDIDELSALLGAAVSRRALLRGTALLASAAGIAPLLAACGGDDDDDDSDETTEEAAETEAPATPDEDAASTEEETEAAATEDETSAEGGSGDETPEAEATEDETEEAAEQPEGGQGGTLIFARPGDSDSLDPQRTVAGASWEVFRNIYDTLIDINAELEFEPLIAESWEASDDGLSYTFVIRDGMKFHDGTDVTAEAVKFTFDRATNPDEPSPVVSFIGNYESAELVDDKTVVLKLSQPAAPFLSNIAVEYFGILSPTAVEELGADFAKNPVGSGPWVFKEWVEGQTITLTPNAEYTNYRTYVENTGPPLADELIFKVIPEAQTQLAAMQTGEANVFVPPTTEVKHLQENSDFQVVVTEGGTNITYIEFAMQPLEGETGEPVFLPPFDDIKVRQAVAHAVDAQTIVDVVLEGLAERNFGLMPTGLFAYDPAIEEFGFHYDPEQAKALLDEAGWVESDGARAKDGTTLEPTFWAISTPTNQQVAQVLQNQFSEAGINIKLELLEAGSLIAQLPENTHNFDMVNVGWPEADILTVIADFGWGMGQYNPQDYMDLIIEARVTLDRDKRKQLYFEAQKLALEDVAAVPLWTQLGVFAARSFVQGFHLNSGGYPVWVDAWVEG